MPSKLDAFMKGLRGLIDEYEKPDDRPLKDWSKHINHFHHPSTGALNQLAQQARLQEGSQSDRE